MKTKRVLSVAMFAAVSLFAGNQFAALTKSGFVVDGVGYGKVTLARPSLAWDIWVE